MPLALHLSDGLVRTRVLHKLDLISCWILQCGEDSASLLPCRLTGESHALI